MWNSTWILPTIKTLYNRIPLTYYTDIFHINNKFVSFRKKSAPKDLCTIGWYAHLMSQKYQHKHRFKDLHLYLVQNQLPSLVPAQRWVNKTQLIVIIGSFVHQHRGIKSNITPNILLMIEEKLEPNIWLNITTLACITSRSMETFLKMWKNYYMPNSVSKNTNVW